MKRYLILENGKVFEGEGFGADGEVTAEIVFTTAMTGFFETLTDRSYTGQAVVQTFPLIGNYGIIPEDAESGSVGPEAYIVREWCDHPSNFRCKCDVDSYLKEKGVVGLCGIDTRALTKTLREAGVMNGIITGDPDKADIGALKRFRIVRPVERVSTKVHYTEGETGAKYKVALMDFGMKRNICRSLVKRGCCVYIMPYDTTSDEILSIAPDGLFLSNGPGDPEDNVGVIENLRALSSSGIPIMGICLGHQLLALANGFKTAKLKYGHRGANHPVRNVESGRVYISSQNHGYAVVPESVDKNIAEPLFINVNDGTNEGLIYKNQPIISVQFHPEACGGPIDTDFLFDEFIKMMEAKKNAAQS